MLICWKLRSSVFLQVGPVDPSLFAGEEPNVLGMKPNWCTKVSDCEQEVSFKRQLSILPDCAFLCKLVVRHDSVQVMTQTLEWNTQYRPRWLLKKHMRKCMPAIFCLENERAKLYTQRMFIILSPLSSSLHILKSNLIYLKQKKSSLL